MKLRWKSNILVAATVAALFTLVRPSPATAAFTVCNYGTVNLALTISWLDSENGRPYEES